MLNRQAEAVSGPAGGDPAPAAAVAMADKGKTLTNLRARAALAGWTLGTFTETDGQTFYLVSRWGKTRELADLGAVALFLRRAGVPE